MVIELYKFTCLALIGLVVLFAFHCTVLAIVGVVYASEKDKKRLDFEREMTTLKNKDAK